MSPYIETTRPAVRRRSGYFHFALEHRIRLASAVGERETIARHEADPAHVSTSFVERRNLTMRMSMRRFTRLTNGFSKKVENLEAAVALHFMWYNFGRVHSTLRVTPAMEAGIADHVWTLAEIVGLLDELDGL
jgi:hypothetical protein